MTSVGSPALWGLFAAIVVLVLALDLGVFHRKAHTVGMREAAVWVTVWVSLAMAFNVFVFYRFGAERGMNFLQAFLLEQALSVDNVFVFIVIFTYFRVPDALQHRVLFWGILGAVITRGIFVVAGVALIERFHWVMYILGAFLVFTAIKILTQKDEEMDPSKNMILRIFRRFVPTTDTYEGSRFVVVRDGRRMATPLLAVLVVIEGTDVVFAVDSIPAVFGVTTDVFIVYTSNIFAILGLRSLFFLIAGLMTKLRYLKVGVALILAFIGVKILIEPFYKVPVSVSLGVLAGVLAISTIASLLLARDEGTGAGEPEIVVASNPSPPSESLPK
jgi:tellurite resistance protein TerC